MSKDLKDYLHYYLGCEVVTNSGTNVLRDSKQSRVATFVGFADYHRLDCRLAFRAGPEGRCNTYLLKPLLRPLSDMTEDEAADVYMIERDRILHSPTNDVDVRQRTDFGWVVTRLDHLNIGLLIKYDGVCYKVINEGKRPTIEPAMNQPLIFHYLLSKHFDLFGLIESGLAISKTKQGI